MDARASNHMNVKEHCQANALRSALVALGRKVERPTDSLQFAPLRLSCGRVVVERPTDSLRFAPLGLRCGRVVVEQPTDSLRFAPLGLRCGRVVVERLRAGERKRERACVRASGRTSERASGRARDKQPRDKASERIYW